MGGHRRGLGAFSSRRNREQDGFFRSWFIGICSLSFSLTSLSLSPLPLQLLYPQHLVGVLGVKWGNRSVACKLCKYVDMCILMINWVVVVWWFMGSHFPPLVEVTNDELQNSTIVQISRRINPSFPSNTTPHLSDYPPNHTQAFYHRITCVICLKLPTLLIAYQVQPISTLPTSRSTSQLVRLETLST